MQLFHAEFNFPQIFINDVLAFSAGQGRERGKRCPQPQLLPLPPPRALPLGDAGQPLPLPALPREVLPGEDGRGEGALGGGSNYRIKGFEGPEMSYRVG